MDYPWDLGWTAIQVHANMVAKQLQIMCHINLVPNILSQWAKTDEGMSVGMSESVGRAQANVRYSKVKRIILPSRCGELVPKNIVEPCIVYTTIFLFHVAFTFDNYERGLTIIQLNPNLNHTFH